MLKEVTLQLIALNLTLRIKQWQQLEAINALNIGIYTQRI